MITRQSELLRVLSLLHEELPSSQWVTLIDERGLVVACVPDSPSVDVDRISAMTAALAISGERVIDELEGGELRFINVAGSVRQQLVIMLGGEFLLSLGLNPEIAPSSTFRPLLERVTEIMGILKKSSMEK
ncbi:MAG: roadblock/LC7 domain-containing protein [Anaerolineales bacterium]|jgi:predicted regulator of Ras-like GTPase activity (Roadblock/LC7/MglB family)